MALRLPAAADARATRLVQVGDLQVRSLSRPRLVIDSRDGTVVVGGDLTVGAAVVSHGVVTLTIGGAPADSAAEGRVSLPSGTSVQEVAAALHAVRTPPTEIAAIFDALHEVGALVAEVMVR